MRRLAAQLARCLPPADARPDGELLAAFMAGGPAAEPAFAELVRRHGPMIWGVCRRHLPTPADAEDAFQAVFLVLVRKARGLRNAPTLGPWLHRVAALTARNVRRRNARRLAKAAPLPADLSAAPFDPDLPLDLDSALLALPEKYRSPIVLCHLLGLTRAEAAARLNCPEGTLSGWLTRGMGKLRAKLRGLDPARSFGVVAAVPAGLAGATIRAAVASHAAAAVVPLAVSRIAEGVIHMFWVKKATAATTALFAVFAMGVGVGMSGRQAVGVADGQEKSTGPGVKRPAPDPNGEVAVGDLEQQIQARQRELEGLQGYLDRVFTVIRVGRGDRGYLDNAMKVMEQTAQAAAELDALKEQLAKRKAALPPGTDKPKPVDPQAELDKRLREAEARLAERSRQAEAEQQRARAELEALRAEIEAMRKAKPPAAEPKKPLGDPVKPAARADIEAQVRELQAQLQRLAADRDRAVAEAVAVAAAAREQALRAAEQERAARLAAEAAAERARRERKADAGRQPQVDPEKPTGPPAKPSPQSELDAKLKELKQALAAVAAERAEVERRRELLAEKESALRAAVEELAARREAEAKKANPDRPRP